MRIVPLVAAIALLSQTSFAQEEHIHAAGKSPVALKLNNDGTDYEAKGDFANARKCFDEAIRIDPSMWPVYLNRAIIDVKEHKLNQGLDDCAMALRGNPAYDRSAVLRADIYAKMGRYDIARSELDKLIALGGRGNAYDQALNSSAWLRATCPNSRFRNGRLAITEATRAVDRPSTHKADYTDTLAAAYAENGDFNSAIRTEEKALSLAKSPQLLKEQHEHLASFKQHRPWRKRENE